MYQSSQLFFWYFFHDYELTKWFEALFEFDFDITSPKVIREQRAYPIGQI